MAGVTKTIQQVITRGVVPCENFIGVVANTTAFCVWKFGSGSNSLPFSTYLAALAATDCLTCVCLGIWNMKFISTNYWISRVPNLCRFQKYFTYVALESSRTLCTVLTVERTLTILFPLKYRAQNVRKRSKYILTITLAFISVGNIPHLLFSELDGMFMCYWGVDFKQHLNNYELIWDTVISIFGSFFISLVCNLACIIALRRSKVQTTTESRTKILQIFKRITILTSVSFMVSVSPWIYCITINHDWSVLPSGVDKLALYRIADAILFLNSATNPLCYFIICRPFRTVVYNGFRRLRDAVRGKIGFLHKTSPTIKTETPHVTRPQTTANMATGYV